MNYTNFNSCWERRAQRQPLGLGTREGRRFGFRAAPAPEGEVDGPTQGLRPAEVRKLVAAGVIGFPAQAVPAPGPVAVAPAKDRVVRPGQPIKQALWPLIQSGRDFSVADLPAADRRSATSVLCHLYRQGHVDRVRPGVRGIGGSWAVYRGRAGA